MTRVPTPAEDATPGEWARHYAMRARHAGLSGPKSPVEFAAVAQGLALVAIVDQLGQIATVLDSIELHLQRMSDE